MNYCLLHTPGTTAGAEAPGPGCAGTKHIYQHLLGTSSLTSYPFFLTKVTRVSDPDPDPHGSALI
jgi:hypothetical protein